MFRILFWFLAPIIIAVENPIFYIENSLCYGYAFGVLIAGAILYFFNVFLIYLYHSRRTPELLANDTWDITAGTGIVPMWVSKIGLLASGLIPSGIVLVVLVFFEIVQ